MNRKFAKFLGSSLLIGLTSLACPASGETLELAGTVRFMDGTPVAGGTVLIYEYAARAFSEPDVRILAVVATDRDGIFHATLEAEGRTLDLRLIRDRCEWKEESVQLTAEEYRGRRVVNVELNPVADNCPDKCT